MQVEPNPARVPITVSAGEAAARLPAAGDDARVDALDAVLPQTQCRQCGYAGCRPYARALAQGSAAINRCPPGGAAGVAALARLLGQAALPVDPACGAHGPLRVARIDESRCIGCTMCIQACPVDAIAGAIKRMHTVLPGNCTGCDLCIAPCPMDCITMEPVQPPRAWTGSDAARARDRLRARAARLAAEAEQNDARLAAKALHKLEELQTPVGLDDIEVARRTAIIERALERVRQRRQAQPAAGGTPPPERSRV